MKSGSLDGAAAARRVPASAAVSPERYSSFISANATSIATKRACCELAGLTF